MTDLERDLHHQKPGADLGNARKRKIKRHSKNASSNPVEPAIDARKTTRSISSNRGGPSSREKIVTDEIRSRLDSYPTLEGQLSSKLGLGRKSSRETSTSRQRSNQAESRRADSPYEATPRAETQRITNSEHGYLPPKNRRVYDARTEVTPPVMVRGGMGGMAFGRVASSRVRKTHPPKRRIDVPLRVTGAEVRLPAIPMVHLGWRAVSLFMALLMSATLLLMWKAPVFQVNTVEARGLKRLTVGDLNAAMGIFRKSVFSLNPELLRVTLSEAFPEFSKISVRINLPANVKVVVTERQPVISWTQDDVESWVDAEGISFPPRGVPDTALVQVEGYGTPPTETTTLKGNEVQTIPSDLPYPTMVNKSNLKLSPDLVSAILTLGAKMPEGTVLVFDSEHGLGWNDPNGWEVFFGNEDQDMQMKLSVYQALVERLKSEGIQPALISVEYVHAPYYRMER
jgi:cell division protein FtsQ